MEIIRTEEEKRRAEEIREILWKGSTKEEEEEFQKWMDEMEKEIQREKESTKNPQTD